MERLSIPGDVCTREAAHAKDSKQSTKSTIDKVDNRQSRQSTKSKCHGKFECPIYEMLLIIFFFFIFDHSSF